MSEDEKDKGLTDTDQIRKRLIEELSAYADDVRERAEEIVDTDVMPVIEGLVNALNEVCAAADRITKSHAHFIQDTQDPGAESIAAEWEMVRLLRQTAYSEPHDWTYISRFSATPQEVHNVLKGGLCEDTYLAYQQFIAEPAVHEAAEELRNYADGWSTKEALRVTKKGADYIDPARGGGPWPYKLVDPTKEGPR